MFGNLKELIETARVVEDEELKILNAKHIKEFLKSIKDWEGWNDKECSYNARISGKPLLLLIESWKKYQQWRFEKYFIDGEPLPDCKTKTGDVQTQTHWGDYVFVWKS